MQEPVHQERPQQGGPQRRRQQAHQQDQPYNGRAEPSMNPARQPHHGRQHQASKEAAKKEEGKGEKRKLTVIGNAYARTAWLFMYDMLDIGKVYFRMGYHDGDDVLAYADAHKLRVPLHDLYVHGYMIKPKVVA